MSNAQSDHGLPTSSAAEAHSLPTGPSALVRANVPPAQGAPLPTTSRIKKRRLSKTDSGPHLSRSTSTPQLKGSIMSDCDLDKKRNKLGYQRISIACGHCRRRKIRCLIAEGDPHNRCQNCIRLKKECVFYPVDQQGAMESRSQSAGKTGLPSGPASAVSPSPPELASGRPFERARQFGSFPSLDHGSHFEPQRLPLEPASVLPSHSPYKPGFAYPSASQPDTGRISPAGYGYQPQEVVPHQWSSADEFSSAPNPTTLAGTVTPQHGSYWQQSNQSPMSGDFAPFPPSSQMLRHATPDSRSFSFPSRDDHWAAPDSPMRSMSYASADSMPPGYLPSHAGYPPSMAQQPQQAMPYGTPMNMHGASGMMQMPGPHSAPPGGPAMMGAYGQQQAYSYHPQVQHPPVTTGSLPSQPAYHSNWYAEPHHYSQPEQDKPSPALSQGPFTRPYP